jgi:hypothetical protein
MSQTTKITENALVYSTSDLISGAGNGETLPTVRNVVKYDPNGASRTGVILQAGVRDGQMVAVMNMTDAAENITFAVAGTSNVADGTASVIARDTARTFYWNATSARWYPSK